MLAAPSGGFFHRRNLKFGILYVTERIVKEDNLPFDIGKGKSRRSSSRRIAISSLTRRSALPPSSHMPSSW